MKKILIVALAIALLSNLSWARAYRSGQTLLGDYAKEINDYATRFGEVAGDAADLGQQVSRLEEEKAGLTAQNNQRARELARQAKLLTERTQTLSLAEGAIVSAKEKISAAEEELTEKRQALSVTENRLMAEEKKVIDYQDRLWLANSDLTTAGQIIKEKEQALTSSQKTIAEKDQTLAAAGTDLETYLTLAARGPYDKTSLAQKENQEIAWAASAKSKVTVTPVILIPKGLMRPNLNGDKAAAVRGLGLLKAYYLKRAGAVTFEFYEPLVITGDKTLGGYEVNPKSLDQGIQAQIVFSELKAKIPKAGNYLVFLAGKESVNFGQAGRLAVIDEWDFNALSSESTAERYAALGLIAHELGHLFGLPHTAGWRDIMGIDDRGDYSLDFFPAVGFTREQIAILKQRLGL